MARREENPRVVDDSRWLAKRNGSYVVLLQLSGSWCSGAREMISYSFQVEETGEKFDVAVQLVYDSINAKAMVDIGRHNKADILSGKF